MRVFLTGATGFIGSAIVQELIKAGHQVLGLARSEAGAQVAYGRRRQGASRRSRRPGRPAQRRRRIGRRDSHRLHPRLFQIPGQLRNRPPRHRSARIRARRLGPALDRHLRDGSAHSRARRDRRRCGDPRTNSFPRVSEEAAASAAAHGVRASVVRLPPSVHGAGDHGFVPTLIAIVREKRVSGYVGEGLNRWPAVHRLDAAHLYRLVLEKVPPGPAIMASPSRASHSETSPPSSAAASTSRSSAKPARKRPPTLVGSRRSPGSTAQPPACSRKNGWDGARRNPDCLPTLIVNRISKRNSRTHRHAPVPTETPGG